MVMVQVVVNSDKKADSAIRKFLAQDIYALSPQILPCDPVDLPDLRYLNTNYAPVKHPFKASFDVESYNSMWFDEQPPSVRPPLSEICVDSLPPRIITDHAVLPSSTPRPDTIDEMTTALSDNNTLDAITEITAESPLSPPTLDPTTDSFHEQVIASIDRLCFVSYKGANTLRPRWYLVQIMLDAEDMDCSTGTYHVVIFRCHPDDMHKSHDTA
jgi:hypothetical protein